MLQLAGYTVWAVLAICLFLVMLYDLRHMKIPNTLSLVLLASFGVMLMAYGAPPDLLSRLFVAAGVFLLGFTGFVLRLVGGGDVKILTALSLFVPVALLPHVLLVFSVALVAGTAAIVFSRKLAGTPESEWAFLRSRKMPMGLPIGLAGLGSLMMLWIAAI